MERYKRAYFLVGRFIQNLFDGHLKPTPPSKISGRLTIKCSLLEKDVSLLHNFPTDTNGRKTFSSDFSCPYAEQGGKAFCVYQGREWEHCQPFQYLSEQAKTTKISVDKDGNGEEIMFEGMY